MKTIVKAEWDTLSDVMVHEPGIETFFGLLEPDAFLYERHFSYRKAASEHKLLQTVLRDEGVTVHDLRDVITSKARKSNLFKERLIEVATKVKRFEGSPTKTKRAHERLVQSVKEGVLDVDHLVNLLLLSPMVNLASKQLHVTCTEPLANLIFTRDQQAVGDKGIVFGRMSENVRRREAELTKLALEALDPSIAYSVVPNATFEGGDFFPLKKFALIGVGPRTNMEGVNQILENGVSFDEVGVVKCPTHLSLTKPDPQVCMHLDTYLNFASDGVAVGYVPLLQQAEVEVYGKLSSRPVKYERQDSMKLDVYLKKNGFNIVNIGCMEQLCYASNFLCIREGYILSVDTEAIAPERQRKLIEKTKEDKDKYTMLFNEAKLDYGECIKTGEFFPHKKELRKYGIEHKHISVTNISGGYGAIHCLTCTLSRS